MNLNTSQQQELAKILEADLFKSAEAVVLSMTDGSVDGLPLDEAAIKMSNEKGVRNAFRLLRKICQPGFEYTPPLPRKALTRTSPRND
jgi:hypothetical protein